jgi:hypothetical protein
MKTYGRMDVWLQALSISVLDGRTDRYLQEKSPPVPIG